ncbi:hypothetical protein Trydic_g7684 [Trypoxylus dichotomus]
MVKSFRSTKAPGPDGVTYRALKHAPKKFVMHMTNIFNAMLRLPHFPSQWMLADVAMIPKRGTVYRRFNHCTFLFWVIIRVIVKIVISVCWFSINPMAQCAVPVSVYQDVEKRKPSIFFQFHSELDS